MLCVLLTKVNTFVLIYSFCSPNSWPDKSHADSFLVFFENENVITKRKYDQEISNASSIISTFNHQIADKSGLFIKLKKVSFCKTIAWRHASQLNTENVQQKNCI